MDERKQSRLVECPIKVWWPEDMEFYEGIIAQIDLETGRARVQYLDGEWEYVHVGHEPCIVGIC